MDARQIAFRTEGLHLAGELVLPDEGGDWIVVLAHGIPSGKPPEPGDLGYGGFARDLAARGIGAFWFDCRGVRGAPGEFSIRGWCDDLRTGLDALAPHTGGRRLALCGSSAGGATAICVAPTRPDISAVATFAAPAAWEFGDIASTPLELIAYFRNIGIVRDPAFPRDPDAWVAEFDEVCAEEAVAGIAPRPLLIVQGEADDVVPAHHGERLFARARQPKELVRIPDGAHQLRKDPRAVDAFADWLTNLPA